MSVALAVLAHPDDAEFLCAGTLLRLARERGYALAVATMTAGDCGSVSLPPAEVARVRRAEGAAAAAVAGADYFCLEERDLRVMYSEAALEKCVRLLQRVRPTVVFTHSPDDYHLDHEQTSKLVRAAAFAAPVPNFFYHPGIKSAALGGIPHLYYCDPVEGKDVFGRPVEPTVRVDVTGVMDAKSRMVACHESQREWMRHHHGVDDLDTTMREWTAKQGAAAGVPFAEGFRQHRGHGYPQACLLASELGADGRGL